MRKPGQLDWYIIIPVFLLFLLGLFVQYSTSPIGSAASSWIDSIVVRQVIFSIVALIITFFITRIDPQIGKTLLFQLLLWGGSFALLAGLFVFGPLVNETQRWYHIGQFLFQPSEFVKIGAVLWAAFWLTQDKFQGISKIFGIIGLLILLGLIILQPDFGATIIISLAVLSMFSIWVVKYKIGRILMVWFLVLAFIGWISITFSYWFLALLIVPIFLIAKSDVKAVSVVITITIILGALLGGIGIAWKANLVPDYVKTRVEDFINSEESFQIRQAKIAIGSGQLSGKGIAQGTQSRLKFLPEYTTDFIFAAYVEERGFVGFVLLFFLYLFLFGRIIFLAINIDDEYSRLVVIGLLTKLWFETVVNIGMNMGVMPTKGVALPFVSYGGSSLLANTIIIGIILTLYRYEAKHVKI